MDWSFVLATVVTGLAVVFAVLIFLIVLIVITGKTLNAKPRKKPAVITPKPVAVKPAPIVIKPQADELQIVAVITAAIHAYGEQAGKQLRIVNIKKREGSDSARSAWGMAGVIENMR
jgi:sodium pump decarboxylase gamma subunit